MSTELKNPTLDMAILQEKANEAAMKGAIQVVTEFYTGFQSPYKEAIKSKLKEQEISTLFSLPDVMAAINKGLSDQIDLIANRAIAESFIPMVSEFLTRTPPSMKFSELLKKFIDENLNESMHHYSALVEEDESYGWLNVTLICKNKNYTFTLHEHDKYNKERTGKQYKLLSLPHGNSTERVRQMELSSGDVTLKLPFTREILSDGFVSFCARLILSGTVFTMDCDDFEEEMFRDEF